MTTHLRITLRNRLELVIPTDITAADMATSLGYRGDDCDGWMVFDGVAFRVDQVDTVEEIAAPVPRATIRHSDYDTEPGTPRRTLGSELRRMDGAA